MAMVNPERIKVVSFDVEGTLVTTDFSYAIWFEAIPQRYAEKNGIALEHARKAVEEEYRKIGDQRLEWYDIRYWLERLGLGTHLQIMQKCENDIHYYPEVREVLDSLNEQFTLIAASGSTRDFLHHLLRDIRPYFSGIYSSITDYKQLKTPQFYLKICQEMKVAPEQVVHIGDNWQFDFVAPSEVGIQALYLDRKGQTENSVENLLELKVRLLDNRV